MIKKDVVISCGAVVVQRRGSELYFLLIKHQKGMHWGLPKGHVDPGETYQQTALREVLEETGLRVELLSEFCKRVSYRIPLGARKVVLYYVGTTPEKKLVLPGDEIRHAVWLELDDAMRLATHRSTATTIRAANTWLMQQPNWRSLIKEAR